MVSEVLYLICSSVLVFGLAIGAFITIIDIAIGKDWTEIFKGDERDE